MNCLLMERELARTCGANYTHLVEYGPWSQSSESSSDHPRHNCQPWSASVQAHARDASFLQPVSLISTNLNWKSHMNISHYTCQKTHTHIYIVYIYYGNWNGSHLRRGKIVYAYSIQKVASLQRSVFNHGGLGHPCCILVPRNQYQTSTSGCLKMMYTPTTRSFE